MPRPPTIQIAFRHRQDHNGSVVGVPGAQRDGANAAPTDDAARRREEIAAAVTSMLEPLAILKSVRADSGEIIDFEWTFINEVERRGIVAPGRGSVGPSTLRGTSRAPYGSV